MNTRNLNNFLALAKSLHFGKASEVCNVSVSALSRNIRQLEEELGVKAEPGQSTQDALQDKVEDELKRGLLKLLE